jgi:hypothetical protein
MSILLALERETPCTSILQVLVVVKGIVLLPENLHTYFELSAQAWTLYKAP